MGAPSRRARHAACRRCGAWDRLAFDVLIPVCINRDRLMQASGAWLPLARQHCWLGSRLINVTDATLEIFVSGQALGPRRLRRLNFCWPASSGTWTGRPQGTGNASGRENYRVPSGLGENGRLMRRKIRPYSRYAHHFSPTIRPFSPQARLAGLMGLGPNALENTCRSPLAHLPSAV